MSPGAPGSASRRRHRAGAGRRRWQGRAVETAEGGANSAAIAMTAGDGSYGRRSADSIVQAGGKEVDVVRGTRGRARPGQRFRGRAGRGSGAGALATGTRRLHRRRRGRLGRVGVLLLLRAAKLAAARRSVTLVGQLERPRSGDEEARCRGWQRGVLQLPRIRGVWGLQLGRPRSGDEEARCRGRELRS